MIYLTDKDDPFEVGYMVWKYCRNPKYKLKRHPVCCRYCFDDEYINTHPIRRHTTKECLEWSRGGNQYFYDVDDNIDKTYLVKFDPPVE